MTNHGIALIPGDGIGTEVLPAARQVLDTVGKRHGITFTYEQFDWSCERYLRHGSMMPEDGPEQLRRHDAILLGAVGYPGVPDHVSLWGLLIPIRRAFGQYVNLRPIRVFDGLPGPVRAAMPGEVDFVVVRENTEGEYSEIGGRTNRGRPDEMAVQQAVFTRAGVTRVLDFAFRLAERRGGTLTSATKSNGIVHTMPFCTPGPRPTSPTPSPVSWPPLRCARAISAAAPPPPNSPPPSFSTSDRTPRCRRRAAVWPTAPPDGAGGASSRRCPRWRW